jgi:hypothetical protein
MSIIYKQLCNLHNLAMTDIYDIAKECDEILGRVTVSEYAKITCIPERTVYDQIKKGKIKTLNGLPCINYK